MFFRSYSTVMTVNDPGDTLKISDMGGVGHIGVFSGIISMVIIIERLVLIS